MLIIFKHVLLHKKYQIKFIHALYTNDLLTLFIMYEQLFTIINNSISRTHLLKCY
jgi:hypothetical protein